MKYQEGDYIEKSQSSEQFLLKMEIPEEILERYLLEIYE